MPPELVCPQCEKNVSMVSNTSNMWYSLAVRTCVTSRPLTTTHNKILGSVLVTCVDSSMQTVHVQINISSTFVREYRDLWAASRYCIRLVLVWRGWLARNLCKNLYIAQNSVRPYAVDTYALCKEVCVLDAPKIVVGTLCCRAATWLIYIHLWY